MSDIKLEAGKRMLELRKQQLKNQSDVAAYLGLTVAAYQNYETGRREAGYETLCKLADYFSTTTDFLLGRAPQTNPFAMLDLQVDIHEDAVMEKYMQLPKPWRQILLEVMKQLGDAAERGERGDIQQNRPSIQIRKHLNKAAAGFGYDLSSEDEWKEIEVVDTSTARAADFAVEIDGDSMMPDFHSGDIALVKFDTDVPVGKVGLFVHDGMGYIKERGKKCLISRNPDYPDIEGEARCIGLVIGVAELV